MFLAAPSHERIYCSLACAWKKKRREFTCEVCGQKRVVQRSGKWTGRFCSQKCWNTSKRKHFGKVCGTCSAEFQGKAGHANEYCSQKCYWDSLKIDPVTYRENRNAYTRKYRREHPEWAQAAKQRRRAREIGAAGHFTEQEWSDLKKKYKNKCAVCKEQKKLTIDHIVPLSKGGTNYIENIQPLCLSCNSRKGVKI